MTSACTKYKIFIQLTQTKPQFFIVNKKLLIADDDINIIASLKYLLNDEGFDVLAVTSAASGYRKPQNAIR